MGRLPVVSGGEAIRRFRALGYAVVRQRGSHVHLRHPFDPTRKPMVIPVHAGRDVKPGLIHWLLQQAGISDDVYHRGDPLCDPRLAATQGSGKALLPLLALG